VYLPQDTNCSPKALILPNEAQLQACNIFLNDILLINGERKMIFPKMPKHPKTTNPGVVHVDTRSSYFG
jgi:hypothetical protein